MKSSMVCLAVFMSMCVFDGSASEALKKEARQRKAEARKKQEKVKKEKARKKARIQKSWTTNQRWT